MVSSVLLPSEHSNFVPTLPEALPLLPRRRGRNHRRKLVTYAIPGINLLCVPRGEMLAAIATQSRLSILSKIVGDRAAVVYRKILRLDGFR